MSLILLLLKHENNIAFFKKIFGIIILFLDIILTFIICIEIFPLDYRKISQNFKFISKFDSLNLL